MRRRRVYKPRRLPRQADYLLKAAKQRGADLMSRSRAEESK